MRTIKLDLGNIPRPHYLISAEMSDDNLTLIGKVLFPSTDISVSDRPDHPHVGHFMFAMGNIAQVIAKESGCKKHIGKEIKFMAFKKARPNQELKVVTKVEYSGPKRKKGKLTINFLNESDLILVIVEAQFFSRW